MSAYPDDFRSRRHRAYCDCCLDIADAFVGTICISCHERAEEEIALEEAMLARDDANDDFGETSKGGAMSPF